MQGRFLTIAANHHKADVLETTTKPNDYATWHLEAAHLHVYYLSSIGSDCQLQISSNRKGPFLSKNRRNWEEWKLELGTDGIVTLCSAHHQTFLGCNSSGKVHTTSSKGEWTRWVMTESSHGGVFLESKAHPGNYLSIHEEGLSTSRDVMGKEESWNLEPRLPSSMGTSRMGGLGVSKSLSKGYEVVGAVEATGRVAMELGVASGLSADCFTSSSTDAETDPGVEDTKSPSLDVYEELLHSTRPICAWRRWRD